MNKFLFGSFLTYSSATYQSFLCEIMYTHKNECISYNKRIYFNLLFGL